MLVNVWRHQRPSFALNGSASANEGYLSDDFE
jgi:hypothetical protein